MPYNIIDINFQFMLLFCISMTASAMSTHFISSSEPGHR